MRQWLLVSAMVAGIRLGPGSTIAPAAAQTPATAPTLYQRLGGYDFLARFVDTAFPRVAGNPQLRRLFQGHSRDSQMRQRQLIVDMLCQATGGPCAYIGRRMREVHTGLGITPSDWDTFLGIIRGALDEFRVPPVERNEFLTIFTERFRPDVVQP